MISSVAKGRKVTLTASMLYCISQRQDPYKPDNNHPLLWRCHWCGAPCGDSWPCGDIHWSNLDVGQKRPVYAACPGEGWMCLGCRMFRRKRMTVQHLDGAWSDGKGVQEYSLWLTEAGCWGVKADQGLLMWPLLLDPPLRFSLALLEGMGQVNHPQLMVVNDHVNGIKSTEPLLYTVNGTKMAWTVYELEQAFASGNTDGTEPGIQTLVRLLGWPPAEKRGRGRPKKEDSNEARVKKQTVPASGTAGKVSA